MSLFKGIVGAVLLSASSIVLAGSLSLAGMSSEGVWSKAYEKYGYNAEFEAEFLNAVGENDKSRIYHLGAGTVICSSLENAKKFYEHSKSNGAFSVINNRSNAYPGCFQPYFMKVVAFRSASSVTNGGSYIKYKFIMTKQPAWRHRFFDNKVGGYAVYDGWTVSKFEMNRLPWKKFVDSDTKRLDDKKDHIKTINNMPKNDGSYPLL